MAENKSVFDILNAVDVSTKIKAKNGLSYLSWASAWAEVKKSTQMQHIKFIHKL